MGEQTIDFSFAPNLVSAFYSHFQGFLSLRQIIHFIHHLSSCARMKPEGPLGGASHVGRLSGEDEAWPAIQDTGGVRCTVFGMCISASHDVDLLDVVPAKAFTSGGVTSLAVLSDLEVMDVDVSGKPSHDQFALQLFEFLPAIDATVGEDHGIWFHRAGGVVSVGDIAGEFVQLHAADGAKRCVGGDARLARCGRAGRVVLTVTCGSLEGR